MLYAGNKLMDAENSQSNYELAAFLLAHCLPLCSLLQEKEASPASHPEKRRNSKAVPKQRPLTTPTSLSLHLP
jgi:hypothetical protein